MTHPLRLFRSFSTELMKIATGIKHDGDVRKLLAERRGEEYLPGGRLITNSVDDLYSKEAGYTSPVGLAASNGTYDVLKSHKKKDNGYQKVRDYAGTAMKGGLTGLGVLGATNAMRGRFGAPVGSAAIGRAAKSARHAAGVGAGLAVADRAYRYSEDDKAKTANIVSSNPAAPFHSPAASFAESNQTGGFHSTVHSGGTAPKPVQMGQKFRIP